MDISRSAGENRKSHKRSTIRARSVFYQTGLALFFSAIDAMDISVNYIISCVLRINVLYFVKIRIYISIVNKTVICQHFAI